MNRTISVTWDDPLASQELRNKVSGLEYSRAIIEGRIPRPPMEKLLGYQLVQAEPGLAVFECLPGEQHYNPIGVVHGGLAMTLLDSAMGCSINHRLPAGAGHATLETKVNMVRPIAAGTGLLRATGKIVHAGRRVATAEGRLEDASGKLYAHGTTTVLIF